MRFRDGFLIGIAFCLGYIFVVKCVRVYYPIKHLGTEEIVIAEYKVIDKYQDISGNKYCYIVLDTRHSFTVQPYDFRAIQIGDKIQYTRITNKYQEGSDEKNISFSHEYEYRFRGNDVDAKLH